MSTNIPDVWTLAAMWGFREDATLQSLHEQIVSAVITGEPAGELWARYLDASEPQVDFPQDHIRAHRARAGREIAQGLIWLEADEVPIGLSHLITAKVAAASRGWTDEEKVLNEEINRHGLPGEREQARAYFLEDSQNRDAAGDQFEEALERYHEAETSSGLSDVKRGHLSLRIAECYLGLLRLGEGNDAWLQEQIVGTIESANLYLQSTPEFARGQALLRQASAEPWWDAAVRRHQTPKN